MKFIPKSALPPELDRLNLNNSAIKNGLFAIGNEALLAMPKIAIVGARRATPYTKELVATLANTLFRHDICVVSGAALGVDIIAHTNSMPHTIAVFGNGLDQIYPRANSNMIQKIYQNALALSEYQAGTPPLRHNFLERNRIVVGLSLCVVIAQADLQSGTMASANIAQRLGVPIFVLPQRLNESLGSNTLLANSKAELIVDFDAFAKRFAKKAPPLQQSLFANNHLDDPLLEFCKNGARLDEALARFGETIYTYELEGKININGLKVSVAK